MRRITIVNISLLILIASCFSAVISAQRPEDSWPIPDFDSNAKLSQREAAATLKAVMMKLERHLCAKPTQNIEAWEQKHRDLVLELTVSQHKLVWTVAGDLAQDEGRNLAGFFPLRTSIQDVLKTAAAATNNPAHATEINAMRERFDAKYNDFTAAADSSEVGRSIRKVYALRGVLTELDREVLSPDNFRLGIDNVAYIARRNAAIKILVDVQKDIYVRTIKDMQRLLSPGSKPFVLYSPNFGPSFEFSKFSMAIAQAFSRFLEKAFDSQKFADLDHPSFYGGVRFSDQAERNMFGECRMRTVRILYVPSRQPDADRAAALLRENGFNVTFEKGKDENAGQDVRGKLYYAQNASRDEATFISNLVNTIEAVDPVIAPTQGTKEAEYALWLPSKPDVKTINWYTGSADLGWGPVKGSINSRLTVRCAPNPSKSYASWSVTGTDKYLIGSAICPAAVHAGVISFDGGVVTIEFVEGSDSDNYVGSTRNGVITQSWQRNWGGFVFIK